VATERDEEFGRYPFIVRTVHLSWSHVTNSSVPSVRGVVAIGHAIVDVLAESTDAFLTEHTLVKGSMELVDETRAVPLYAKMAEATGGKFVVQSGGSAANTAVVSAVLGTPTAFVGKVREDELGHEFARDLEAVGVSFATLKAAGEGAATGRCLINVTPDAERTMSTFLGAARGLRVPDMDEAVFSNAAVTYVEGYLWDEPLANEALLLAIKMAHDAGRKSSFTLSDSFLVDRFRAEFHQLIPLSIDILFANEHEICSLFETDDLDLAVKSIGSMCPITTVTRGAEGSLVIADGKVIEVRASRVDKVVDTTGAGDAYAGGFLYGFSEGLSLARSAEIGNIAAAEVISRLGARPTPSLVTAVHG
jgi:sugar/nucleoside kinase (ribokinase family)